MNNGKAASDGAGTGPAAAAAVCVFCGARNGKDPRFVALAHEFGAALARRGSRLVYGGGRVGLMGALADGALSAGGEVVGVIPRLLMDREVAHTGLTRLEVVDDMAVRKQRMIEISDAFVALPGGLGTLDELFEVLTLQLLGQHSKPSALLDDRGFWQPLMSTCQALVEAGFVNEDAFSRLIVEPDPGLLLERLDRAVAQAD